jgi:hypothetical protein
MLAVPAGFSRASESHTFSWNRSWSQGIGQHSWRRARSQLGFLAKVASQARRVKKLKRCYDTGFGRCKSTQATVTSADLAVVNRSSCRFFSQLLELTRREASHGRENIAEKYRLLWQTKRRSAGFVRETRRIADTKTNVK